MLTYGSVAALWVAVGTVITLRVGGVSETVANLCGSVFLFPFLAANINVQSLATGLIFSIMDVFFSEIGTRGTQHMPKEGTGTIVAIAPHANQFIDPCVAMRALNRPMRFLVAAKSMRKSYIAAMAKPLGAIPVERPQDLKVKGSGTITVEGNCVLGVGTNFTKIFSGNGNEWFIACTSEGKFAGCRAVVDKIISDTELSLKVLFTNKEKQFINKIDKPTNFCALPHLDHSNMFNTVFDSLRKGNTVAIFPEGGSHDRTRLLPLKKGIAHMALGAAAAHPGLDVKIVPIGLNYFSGHRFRSRVFVDVAEPLSLSAELVGKYKEGGEARDAACEEVMATVEEVLRTVTVDAPDSDSLQLFWALRRLYMSTSTTKGDELDMQQKLDLTRNFATGYEKVKDEPKMLNLLAKVQVYSAMLKVVGMSDHQVDSAPDTNTATRVSLLLQKTCALLVYVLALLPFGIMCYPFLRVTRHIAKKKAAEALAHSKVKIKGNDVLATWKLLVSLVLIPMLHFFYCLVFFFYFGGFSAITYFFFSPFVYYAGMLGGEHSKLLYRSLVPLWRQILSPAESESLQEVRHKLQAEVKEVVEHYNLIEKKHRQ